MNPYTRSSLETITGPIIFQSLSWNIKDREIINDDSDQEQDPEQEPEYICEIFIHGILMSGHSIGVKVLNYCPYFYVEVPEDFTQFDISKKILKGLPYKTYVLCSKVKLYPYTQLKKCNFVKLIFSSLHTFRKGLNRIKYNKRGGPPFNVYESKVDHITRLCHLQGISTTGIIEIDQDSYEICDTFSSASINIITSYKDLKEHHDQNLIMPIKILSYDIETCPEDLSSFPRSKNPNDIVAQIGITLYTYSTKEKIKIILTSRPCSDIEGAFVIASSSEKELLEKFCDIVSEIDPDILTGYNTWGFDDEYIWNRMLLCNVTNYNNLGRFITNFEVDLEIKELKSSAYGANSFKFLNCPGREIFDLYVYLKKNFNLESYKLDDVSYEKLGANKVDLPYREMFSLLTKGPDDIRRVAIYCIQDTNLVIDLINKLCIISNSIEMAKTTCVPLNWLLFRGQQCKVYSLIAKECLHRDFLIPDDIPMNDDEFEGATVIEPKKGAYYVPVAGLDFASLYPSIMIAYNMCYSTLVLPESNVTITSGDPKYEIVEWSNDDKTSIVHYKNIFVQYKTVTRALIESPGGSYEKAETIDIKDPEVYEGILPSILIKLWTGRKKTKKLMSAEKDPFIKEVLNGKQLAQKVTMNSIYGFTGANKGMLPCKPIAASVTAVGRSLIMKTGELALQYFPGQVLYGDSVPKEEKIYIMKKKGLKYTDKRIVNMDYFDNEPGWEHKYIDAVTNDRKEYYVPKEDLYTYSMTGTSKILKIIRHKTSKRIFKIKTSDNKTVLVTEGHSLIDSTGALVKAENLTVGHPLWTKNL